MVRYSYKAMTASGRMMLGQLDAINPAALEARLNHMDLDLITSKPVTRSGLLRTTSVPRRELINFCFHLEHLCRAGVPIVESLSDLRDSIEVPRFREVMANLIESIEGGKTLSQAMAEHPKVFDAVFTSLIRAGEDSGKLPEVLKNLNESLRWQDELAAHTGKLVMYPAFTGVIVVAVFFFMMIYLVPKMVGFIKNMGQQIPLQTKILIATSDFMVHYWYLVIILPLLIVGGLTAAVRSNSAARYWFDDIKLKAPLLGNILRKIILSRFAAVFAMMYSSGISILDAIHTTEDVVGNAVIKDGLRNASRGIAEGQSVTSAFQRVGLFPPLIIRMLKIGESTGALDVALINVSYFYNRDVKESIERVQTMIEPVMTVIVGLILGWVMLSVLGPIYDTISKLKI
ncbi:MAG TPA: type II secretion system F family protein [Rhodocyclaceae bacterium]|jgi:type IV pilus assembly protein PilC